MFLIDRLETANISNKKMDILFYEAIKGAKSGYYKKILFHAFKLILLIAFYIVDWKVLNSDREKLFILMRFGIATSVLNMIVNFIIMSVGYLNTTGNNRFFVYLS